jgi:hypothetical protein
MGGFRLVIDPLEQCYLFTVAVAVVLVVVVRLGEVVVRLLSI